MRTTRRRYKRHFSKDSFFGVTKALYDMGRAFSDSAVTFKRLDEKIKREYRQKPPYKKNKPKGRR